MTITTGHGTYIDNGPIIHTYGHDYTITVGAYCSIAADVEFLPGGMHLMDRVSTFPFQQVGLPGFDAFARGEIMIGNDVWIGRGARIIGGAHIADGAIVGAYAVVAGHVPAYHVAIGNPARCHPRPTHQLHADALLRIAWWNWPHNDPRLRDVIDLSIAEFCARHDR